MELHHFKTGDLIRYIRTEALYLLLEQVELTELTSGYRKKGAGFRVMVIYSGRSYTKQSAITTIFIPFDAPYYVVLSGAIGAPLDK
jgi:hypothetical protein|tara:strand:- start:73 stop:330 length:258 start_codon:yes stop_codon:yes gene_type:complete